MSGQEWNMSFQGWGMLLVLIVIMQVVIVAGCAVILGRKPMQLREAVSMMTSGDATLHAAELAARRESIVRHGIPDTFNPSRTGDDGQSDETRTDRELTELLHVCVPLPYDVEIETNARLMRMALALRPVKSRDSGDPLPFMKEHAGRRQQHTAHGSSENISFDDGFLLFVSDSNSSSRSDVIDRLSAMLVMNDDMVAERMYRVLTRAGSGERGPDLLIVARMLLAWYFTDYFRWIESVKERLLVSMRLPECRRDEVLTAAYRSLCVSGEYLPNGDFLVSGRLGDYSGECNNGLYVESAFGPDGTLLRLLIEID